MAFTGQKAHHHGFCYTGSHVGSPSLKGPVQEGGMGSKGGVEALCRSLKFFRIPFFILLHTYKFEHHE